jgi:hypothetical protein
VVPDLRHELALDRLERDPAVTEDAPVGQGLDRPQPEPLALVPRQVRLDPGDDLGARLRGRVVAHRYRVAEDREEVVDVREAHLAETKPGCRRR